MTNLATRTERGGDRNPAIYGIRGLAALALLTVHVAMFSGLLGTKALGTPRPPTNFLGGFLVSGLPSFIGVFFVLPALFLYLPLARSIIAGTPRAPQGGSLARRLFRLLPAYYVMYLVVLLAFNRDAIDGVWYVLRPILLLQVYLPTPFAPNFINGMEVTWTVPSMVQWYVALPLIAWATHRWARRGETPAIRARRLMLPVPILIALGVGWLFFVKAQGWDNRMVFWWPQGFAPTIGIGMALAIMLALIQVSPADTPRIFKAAAAYPSRFWLGALVVYVVNCVRPFSVIGMDAIYSVPGLLVTYLMVAAFGLLASLPLVAPGTRPHAVRTLLSIRPIAYVGEVSYGIYLWHFAAMHFYLQPGSILSGHARPIREFYGTVGFWELEIATLVGAIGMASVSYYLLEQPIGAWADRYFRGRRSAAPPALARPRPTALPRGRASTEPVTPVLTAEQAAAALEAAAADRDAIRANLLELEHGLDRQPLTGTVLCGQTRSRWQQATVDITALWDTFTAYSAVLDEATDALAGRGLVVVTDLLGGDSVRLTREPAPLAQRHITDDGRARLTLADAVRRMNDLFGRTAAFVTTVETVWREVSGHLDAVAADLAAARSDTGVGAAGAAALDGVEVELAALREALGTDPLALWRDGRVDTDRPDELRHRIGLITGGRVGAL